MFARVFSLPNLVRDWTSVPSAFLTPPPRQPQAHRVGTPSSLCRDISLTPAILLVLLHVGVSAAEDSLEKVLAMKKAEEEQETLEPTILVD